MFDTGTFFGVGNSVERIVLGDSKLRGFELPNKLCIYHHSEFVYDDFRPNRCIKKLAAGGVTYNWKGPFLALRSKDDLSDFAEDATLADFSHIVEYFATYAKPVVVRGVRDPNLRPKKGMIRGVRIVPASSGKDGSNPFTFEAVDIARDHAVFRGTAAPLSMRVRFPIMAVPIKQTISVGPGTVSPAALLYQEYDASSENWGAPPGEWFLGEGGAIAVAFGTHTLNPSDLEALCAFAEDEVLPRQYATMMDGSKKDTLVNFITEENFGAYAMRFFAGALNRSPLPQMTWVPVSGTGKWMPSMRQ
ncbi:MAG: hypothetical protein M1820_003816 [Bogoriella megaspora]|nr:MAG: hypothetical protein M1820_003816 [Bogoriella megaspora]